MKNFEWLDSEKQDPAFSYRKTAESGPCLCLCPPDDEALTTEPR